MLWLICSGLALAEDTELDLARQELSALMARTEDPTVLAALTSIEAHLAAAAGDGAEPSDADTDEPEPEPEPTVPACTVEEYDDLRETVEAQAFSRDKIAVVERASRRLHFDVEQVVGLLGVLDFGADKVQAAAILHPRVVDLHDFERVYEALVFDTDRDALRALVEEPDPGP